MRWKVSWVVLAGSVSACAPPEAPTELSELSRYMYREWDASDDRVRAAGVVNLEAFLSSVDLGVDKLDDRSWTLSELKPEDVAAIERPDRALEDCFGLGMGYLSRWPIQDHARLQMEPDQKPSEPTAEFYDRAFTNLDDASCFPDQDCDRVDTTNELRRKTFLYAFDSTLFKNFRWVPFTTDDGTERDAFYSRSWYAKSWESDNGSTTVWQSYSIDVWIDRGDGTSWRFQTLWNETEIAGTTAGESTLSFVQTGTEDVFDAGDDAIGALYHDEPTP